MNIKKILESFENEKDDIVFDTYDGLSVLFISEYDEDNYFIYYWTFENYEKENKKLELAYRVSHLKYKDIQDIVDRKKPLIEYYKNKDTYDSRLLYDYDKEEKVMIVEKSITPLDENPPDNYIISNVDELKKYIMNKKIKKF